LFCEFFNNLLGHEGVGSEDGHQAIDLYLQALNEGRRFDLVLMDLTIPGGMGGKEAIVEILRIDPDAKVVVSSGYANDQVMSNFREYGFAGILSKPFLMDEINRTISNLL
jgi:DNA-binding NarL/FixJ family response regulator